MRSHWNVQKEDFYNTISRLDGIKQRWGRWLLITRRTHNETWSDSSGPFDVIRHVQMAEETRCMSPQTSFPWQYSQILCDHVVFGYLIFVVCTSPIISRKIGTKNPFLTIIFVVNRKQLQVLERSPFILRTYSNCIRFNICCGSNSKTVLERNKRTTIYNLIKRTTSG